MKEQNYLDHLVGVFGHPVAENPGVVIQEAAFEDMGLSRWRFLTIDVEPQDLGAAIEGLKAFKMRGINCTIPHKIQVLKYLDRLSESAALIGAVNTIVNEDGKLYGDNTDGKGFMEALRENGMQPKGKRVVILGAGGYGHSDQRHAYRPVSQRGSNPRHSAGQHPAQHVRPGCDPQSGHYPLPAGGRGPGGKMEHRYGHAGEPGCHQH